MPVQSKKIKPVVIEEIKKSAIKDLLVITVIFLALLVLLVIFHLESNHHLFLGLKYNGLLEVNELLVVVITFILCAFVYIWRRLLDMKAIQNQILKKAYYDTTTALPNRDFVFERLEKHMAQTQKGQHFAIAFIDFDRFKNINDTYGHNIGDELLRQVGQRLSSVVSQGEVIARLGGDEFLFVSKLDAHCNMQEVVSRLQSTHHRPFCVGALELSISYSIGIAIYPDDGLTIGELLKAADKAMYRAKAQGSDYCFYSVPDKPSLPLH